MNGIDHHFTFGVSDETFNRPTGVAGFEDRIVVSDEALDRVQIFDDSGVLEFLIGGRGDGPGEFVQPRGVAANADRIYVADEGNNRVQAFDDSGAFLWMTPPNLVRRPFDVAIVDERIAIADSDNGRVLLVDGAGNPVGEIPGLNWPRALTSGGDLAQLYVLDNDEVLAFEKPDSSQPIFQWVVPPPPPTGPSSYGNVWGIVFDEVNERVVVSDQRGPSLHVFEPDGTLGTTVWSYGTGKEQFETPQGLGAYRHGVLVADHGNSRIVSDEWNVEIGGTPQPLGHVHLPSDLAFSPRSELVYVADTENGRVQAFNSDGEAQFTFGEMDLRAPTGVAVGRDSVFAIDPLGTSVKVAVYELDGTFDRDFTISSIPSVASSSGLANHCRAAVDDETGELLIAFRGLGTIGRYTANGAVVHVYNVTVGTLAGGGTPISPTDVAPGPKGTVYAADPDGRRIVQLDAGGRFEEFRDPTVPMRPETLVVDSQRNQIVVGDGSSIFTIDLRRGRVAEIESRGAGDGEFRNITAMTSKEDVLYVAERSNNRIQAITLD